MPDMRKHQYLYEFNRKNLPKMRRKMEGLNMTWTKAYGKITPQEKTFTIIDENNDEWIYLKLPRKPKFQVKINWEEFGIREV